MSQVDEFRMVDIGHSIAAVIMLARTVTVDDAKAYAAAARKQQSGFDALVSITDPTRWQREHMGVQAAARVAQSFYELRRTIEESLNPEAGS